MLTLRDIRVWDTSERIDLVIPGHDGPRLISEAGSVIDGDIDASGLVVAPGFADPHVHLRDPGQTYKESMRTGCTSAASGGYTNLLIMPNTLPPLDGLPVAPGQPGAEEVLAAGCAGAIDYLQHYEGIHHIALPSRYELCVCASRQRAGQAASNPNDWMRYLAPNAEQHGDPHQRAHPVTAMSDDGSAVTSAILEAVLANLQQTGLALLEHCEHHETGVINEGEVSRQLGVDGVPASTELAIVERDIEAARRTGVHIHLQHVSTAAAFQAVREAKRQGLPVTCETAPHYLALCDEDVLQYGSMAKMNPPLRSKADQRATIEAVCDGTVDLLATDHAPHTLEEKRTGLEQAPNGIIGLETAYGVCHSVLVDGGYIDEARLIALMSKEPARLMGRPATDIARLLEQSDETSGGRTLDLGVADDAENIDLTILDPTARWTVDPERFHSKARNTPFAGWALTGRPLATVIASKLVFSRIPGPPSRIAPAQHGKSTSAER